MNLYDKISLSKVAIALQRFLSTTSGLSVRHICCSASDANGAKQIIELAI